MKGEITRECGEQRTGESGENRRGVREQDNIENRERERLGRREEGREQESGEKNPETLSQARAKRCLRSLTAIERLKVIESLPTQWPNKTPVNRVFWAWSERAVRCCHLSSQ